MKTKSVIAIFVTLVMIAAVYTQITVFVIPPIGAIPEGKTIIITRMSKTEFIDSPDAVCERIQGGVSLLCRGLVMGAVAENSTLLIKLPYSSILYEISTSGNSYDR